MVNEKNWLPKMFFIIKTKIEIKLTKVKDKHT